MPIEVPSHSTRPCSQSGSRTICWLEPMMYWTPVTDMKTMPSENST